MKKYIWIVILLFILCVGFLLYKGTYSINEEDNSIKRDLILKYDNDNLEVSIYNYIDMIDDVLLPTSSYVMSSVLSDNYDFLTTFAINYILKNVDVFNSDIYVMDNYRYNDGYMDYSTNKYVKKDIIYMITKGLFNKSDYVIINDYLEVKDEMVPLLITQDYEFKMDIDKIEVNKFGDNYIVNVNYKDNDLVYRYIFVKVDDRLILKNLEI